MVVLLVKILAIALILWGCYIIYKPEMLKKVFAWAKEGNNVYVIGGLRALLGILLILFASSCRVPWVIFLLGALSILSGVIIYIIKKETIYKLIEWIETRKQKQIYQLAAVVVVLGVIIALAA